MEVFIAGFREAFRLLFSIDGEVYQIIKISLIVSGGALMLSSFFGIPIGAFLGLTKFKGKSVVTLIIYTGMGLPPVLVGLLVYLLLSRSGPMGNLEWLFTVKAMIMAQTIIALPLVIGFTMSAVMGVDKNLIKQMESLGATPYQRGWETIKEARLGVLGGIAAAFGRIVAEVGAVMLVGGNIKHSTRVLTTAIVLETRQGNFGMALAFGIILLILSLTANISMMYLLKRMVAADD